MEINEVNWRNIGRVIRRHTFELKEELYKKHNDLRDSNNQRHWEFVRKIEDKINLLTERMLMLADTENRLIAELDQLKKHNIELKNYILELEKLSNK